MVVYAGLSGIFANRHSVKKQRLHKLRFIVCQRTERLSRLHFLVNVPSLTIRLGISLKHVLRSLYIYTVDRYNIRSYFSFFVLNTPIIPFFLPFF